VSLISPPFLIFIDILILDVNPWFLNIPFISYIYSLYHCIIIIAIVVMRVRLCLVWNWAANRPIVCRPDDMSEYGAAVEWYRWENQRIDWQT
jgi:hypothetical protein